MGGAAPKPKAGASTPDPVASMDRMNSQKGTCWWLPQDISTLDNVFKYYYCYILMVIVNLG
jgi:hypothetical protein